MRVVKSGGLWRATVALAWVAGLLNCGGCTALSPVKAQLVQLKAENMELRRENWQLKDRLKERNAVMAHLQIVMMKKDEEIARLGQNRKGLAKEIASNIIRTPAASTKVETVAYLAEVTTEITSAKEKERDGDTTRLVRAEGMLAASNRALENDRYEQASLLAAQALALVTRQEQAVVEKVVVKPGSYVDFVMPLEMRVAKKSHVRRGPTRSAAVMRVVGMGTSVIGEGFQGSWVKVRLEDGRIGWIYYTLLAIPSTLETGEWLPVKGRLG